MNPIKKADWILRKKTQVYEKIKERVELYSKIKISDAAKRMGSCSANDNFNFSWRLIMATIEHIDYVVVHELIHLAEQNHSRNFWKKVGAIIPDYRKKDSFLKHNFRLFGL